MGCPRTDAMAATATPLAAAGARRRRGRLPRLVAGPRPHRQGLYAVIATIEHGTNATHGGGEPSTGVSCTVDAGGAEDPQRPGGRRVVVTSSISAMMPNPRWPRDDPGRPVDKECWTDLDYCKVHKTMAEKAACKYAEKHKLDMVTIDPSTSVGLLLQPGQNAGPAILQQLLQVLLKKLKPGPVACKMWQRSCLGLAFTPLEEAIKTLKRA